MINSPLTQQSSKQQMMTADDLVTLHHRMMICYGWISLDEFRKIPLPTLFQLKLLVEEEILKSEESRLYALKFY